MQGGGGEGGSCQNRMWKLQAFSGSPRKKLGWSETKRREGEMHEPGDKKKANKKLNLKRILDFRFHSIFLRKMLNECECVYVVCSHLFLIVYV